MQVHDPIVTPRTNMATASRAAFCFNYSFDRVFGFGKTSLNTLIRAMGIHLVTASCCVNL
jgi:hypothetical protein